MLSNPVTFPTDPGPHLPRLGEGGASSFGLRLRTGERCSRRGRSKRYRKACYPPPVPLRMTRAHKSIHMLFPSELPILCPPTPAGVPLWETEPGLVLHHCWPSPPETRTTVEAQEPSLPHLLHSSTHGSISLTSRGLELVLMHRHCSSPF